MTPRISLEASLRADAQELARRVGAAVRERTGGRVRNLKVEVQAGEVTLHGRCDSFYCKQLAQHAAKPFVGPRQLTNQIEVNERCAGPPHAL